MINKIMFCYKLLEFEPYKYNPVFNRHKSLIRFNISFLFGGYNLPPYIDLASRGKI